MEHLSKRIPIRQLSLLSLLFLCVMNLSAAERFFESYSPSERLVIAGAYLAVSEQYDELGEQDRAEGYRALAEQIFPGIQPGDMTVPDAPPESEKVEASLPARPSGKEPAAVQYYIGKLLRAVFSENRTDIDSVLTTRLYLPGYDNGVSRKDVLAYVDQAFLKYELDRTDPALIYELGRLYIQAEGSSWVAGIDLSDEGMRIFADEIGFPGKRHKFYFREFREGWRLIAVNAE